MTKLEDIKLKYDILWFDIFMDSDIITFDNKERYSAEEIKVLFDLLVGNIGAAS